LVDFNENLLTGLKPKKTRRRKSSSKSVSNSEPSLELQEESSSVVEDATVVEDVKEVAPNNEESPKKESPNKEGDITDESKGEDKSE
jgi:hypothetical protein